MTPTLEVQAEQDRNLLTGKEIVRVRYRTRGARTWRRFSIIPTDDQTIAELLATADKAAEAHYRAHTPQQATSAPTHASAA